MPQRLQLTSRKELILHVKYCTIHWQTWGRVKTIQHFLFHYFVACRPSPFLPLLTETTKTPATFDRKTLILHTVAKPNPSSSEVRGPDLDNLSQALPARRHLCLSWASGERSLTSQTPRSGLHAIRFATPRWLGEPAASAPAAGWARSKCPAAAAPRGRGSFPTREGKLQSLHLENSSWFWRRNCFPSSFLIEEIWQSTSLSKHIFVDCEFLQLRIWK